MERERGGRGGRRVRGRWRERGGREKGKREGEGKRVVIYSSLTVYIHVYTMLTLYAALH